MRFDNEVMQARCDPDPVFDMLWHPRPPWYRPIMRRQWDRELRKRRNLMRVLGVEARFW